MDEQESLVSETLSEMNEERQRVCKVRVRELVSEIFSRTEEIAKHAQGISELKEELRKLKRPENLKLEI